MKLHNHFRFSASFRVRVALTLKNLPCEYLPMHLVKGEHLQPGYSNISADGLVPQIFSAQRFNTPLGSLPRTMAVFDARMALPAFQVAQPSACPDAEV